MLPFGLVFNKHLSSSCDVPDSVISGEKVIKNEEDMVPVLRKFSIIGETHIADNLTMTWEV